MKLGSRATSISDSVRHSRFGPVLSSVGLLKREFRHKVVSGRVSVVISWPGAL